MWGLWPLLLYRDAYTPMGTHPSRLSPGLFLFCVSISGFPGICCLFSLLKKKKLFCIWKSIVKAVHIQPVEKYGS